MIIPKNILKFWGVFFIILAVALGVITLIYRWHRIFPTHEVSEIYSRYAKEEEIDAAFVKDYRVNDSITVDVTVLEATTDSAWAVLRDDFKLPVLPKEYERLAEAMSIDVWRAPRSNPYALITKRSPDDYIVAVSRPKRIVYVFDTKNDIESNAIKIHKYSTFIK